MVVLPQLHSSPDDDVEVGLTGGKEPVGQDVLGLDDGLLMCRFHRSCQGS